MRVLCIDDSNEGHPINIKEGEIYIVQREDDTNYTSPAYFLLEIPDFPYNKRRFIPLSDIDETTFERNYIAVNHA